MVRKRQDDQTRLLLEDAKFEPSKLCELCGQPTRSASVKCLGCLQALYLTEELAYTREWLREHPGTLVELGHDRHKLVHLVFMRASVRNLGWCGTKVTQVKAKRGAAPPGRFPPGICVRCRSAYEGMGL